MARASQAHAGEGEMEEQMRLFPEAPPAMDQVARSCLSWEAWARKDLNFCHGNPHLGKQLAAFLVGAILPFSPPPARMTQDIQTAPQGAESQGTAPFFDFELKPYCIPSPRVPSGLNSATPAKFCCYLNGKKTTISELRFHLFTKPKCSICRELTPALTHPPGEGTQCSQSWIFEGSNQVCRIMFIQGGSGRSHLPETLDSVDSTAQNNTLSLPFGT